MDVGSQPAQGRTSTRLGPSQGPPERQGAHPWHLQQGWSAWLACSASPRAASSTLLPCLSSLSRRAGPVALSDLDSRESLPRRRPGFLRLCTSLPYERPYEEHVGGRARARNYSCNSLVTPIYMSCNSVTASSARTSTRSPVTARRPWSAMASPLYQCVASTALPVRYQCAASLPNAFLATRRFKSASRWYAVRTR